MQQGSLTTFLCFYVQTLKLCCAQGALLYIITAYHETIINTFLCRSVNVNEY